MADTKISGGTPFTGSGAASRGAARAGSTTTYRTVDNINATVDPTATDDSALFYHVGSRWMRTDTGEDFVCLDATATAAVWVSLNPPGWRRARTYGVTWAAGYGAATVSIIGPSATAVGSAAGSNSYATTNERTRRKRVPQTTTAAAGSGAGHRQGNSIVMRGGASGRNGFRLVSQFAINTMPASWRAFTGLYGTSGAIGNVDPSSLLNIVGVGKDAADTAWQIMTNDGTGAATKVALNATSFPINDTAAVFELELFCPPGNAQNVTYWFRRISGVDVNGNNTYAAQVTGTISADLPAVDTAMYWHQWLNNDVNAAAGIIDTMKVYFEAFGDM